MKLDRLVGRPTLVFWLACAVLVPVSLASVIGDPWFTRPPKPVGDGLDYDNIAFHVSIGRGFYLDNRNPQWLRVYQAHADEYRVHLEADVHDLPATGRPPLYPTILAGFYSVLGRGEVGFGAVRIFSALCLGLSGALAVALTAVVIQSLRGTADSLLHSRGTAVGLLIALGLAANNRTLFSYANDFLTEPLALLLTQLFVSVLVCTSLRSHANGENSPTGKFPRYPWHVLIAAGLLLGAMILTRSIFFVWIPGVWILLTLSLRGSFSQRGLQSCVVLLVAGVCCMPWWTRNILVLERFMPLGTQGPITMLGGYSDAALAAAGDWQPEPDLDLRRRLQSDPLFLAARSNTAREIVVARAASAEVRSWIAAHLGDLPWLFLQRVVTHWNPYYGRSLGWKLCILAGAVTLMRMRHRSSILLVGMPILSTLVVGMLYTTGGRFLVPLYGVLYTLAGIGGYAAFVQIGTRLRRKAVPAIHLG